MGASPSFKLRGVPGINGPGGFVRHQAHVSSRDTKSGWYTLEIDTMETQNRQVMENGMSAKMANSDTPLKTLKKIHKDFIWLFFFHKKKQWAVGEFLFHQTRKKLQSNKPKSSLHKRGQRFFLPVAFVGFDSRVATFVENL